MNEPDQLPRHRRDQLEQMVGSEIARLERLMQHRGPATTDVDLDEAIEPLVVATMPAARRRTGRPPA